MTSTETINQFYTAFANRNLQNMISCYHDEVVFEDPAFGVLNSQKVKAMWEMLLSSKDPLIITHTNVQTNGSTGSADWKAEYVFWPKKRKVVNRISAEFEFLDGKIIKHTDSFNLWNWSKQSIGLVGYFIGWSSSFKSSLNTKTKIMLEKYMARNGQ